MSEYVAASRGVVKSRTADLRAVRGRLLGDVSTARHSDHVALRGAVLSVSSRYLQGSAVSLL